MSEGERCHICDGEGWVCEYHPSKAWKSGGGCCGGAGAPCICNRPDVGQQHSLKWLRGQAKKLKKESGIKHHQALEAVAVEHGFPNWKELLDAYKCEHDFETRSCGYIPGEPEEFVRMCTLCGWEAS